MIQLFLNQGFKTDGLVPDLENIKRYLQSKSIEFNSDQYADLDELRGKNLADSLVRCDLDFGMQHVTQLAMAPEAVRFNRTFDSVTFESGSWLPRLKYFDILRRKIVTHFGNVEINENAGIICDSCSLEGLVSVVVSLGFRSIILFVPDNNETSVDQLSRYFIGVKIKTVPFSILTQNQDQTSLMINSVDVEKNPTLMSDLAYFNFMTSKGIVVDLASKTPMHPLLFEAEKAGLRTLKRHDLVAFYDYESLRAVHPPLESTKNEFFQNYR